MTDAHFPPRSCPLCGSDKSQPEVSSRLRAETMDLDAVQRFWSGLFKERPFFSYHRCADCGLLYNPVYFDDGQLGALYGDMAPNMHIVSNEAIIATQRGYFERAKSAGAPLRGGYLEIGPDVGHIVSEAARIGNFEHFWLFEPNQAIHAPLHAAAGNNPATICADMTDLSPVPDGSVGLAVMIHVLDHLVEPLPMLEQIRKKLLPGGRLMIVTHNERSLLRKVMGVKWPPFCLQHPEIYSPQTMQALLARAGYQDVAVERSINSFPIDFLAKQAAWTVGLQVKRMPLPSLPIPLRLGNILTMATAPAPTAVNSNNEGLREPSSTILS